MDVEDHTTDVEISADQSKGLVNAHRCFIASEADKESLIDTSRLRI